MFGLTPAATGLAVGLVLGFLNFVTLRWVADRMEEKSKSDEQKAGARLLRIFAVAEIAVFAAVGYFVGPMLLN